MIEYYITILILFINYYSNIICLFESIDKKHKNKNKTHIPDKLDKYVAGPENVGDDADPESVVLHKTVHPIQANAAVHLDEPLEGSRTSSFRTAEPKKPKDGVWASITDGFGIAHGFKAVIFLLFWAIFNEFTLNTFKQILN